MNYNIMTRFSSHIPKRWGKFASMMGKFMQNHRFDTKITPKLHDFTQRNHFICLILQTEHETIC